MMKAIMIIYNQAHTERVEYMLDKLGIEVLFGKMFMDGVATPVFLSGNPCLA